MKLPKISINKINPGLMINLLLIVVILLEIYMAYTTLYININPQAAALVLNKIVKIDLKAYKDTTDLIQSRTDFVPSVRDYQNQNPFKYNQ